MNFTSKIGAWLYPDAPGAQKEYQDGRTLYMLKPEYYRLDAGGVLTQILASAALPNAYSPANAIDVKKYSQQQFFTISCGDPANMDALCSDTLKSSGAISIIIAFLQTIQFTGVELDWEGFGKWTPTQYNNFKIFLGELSTALHNNGFQLMVDVPPITALNDKANGQQLYQLKYEELAPLTDYICIMAYDKQYDFGAGTSISPNLFVQQVCDWAMAKIADLEKIVVGMPSYGYHGATGSYIITEDNEKKSATYPGYSTAARNADSEMNWKNAGKSYFYQDTSGLNAKRLLIEAKGIKHIHVWSLGGNLWFTNAEPLTTQVGTVIKTRKVNIKNSNLNLDIITTNEDTILTF